MFESGIGPGVRSDRFGTWSLITFLLLFVPLLGYVAIPGLSVVAWIPVVACIGTTLGALGCGLVGVFVSGQRRTTPAGAPRRPRRTASFAGAGCSPPTGSAPPSPPVRAPGRVARLRSV